jgi:hypothetical protein
LLGGNDSCLGIKRKILAGARYLLSAVVISSPGPFENSVIRVQCLADKLLGNTGPVGVRGIDEIDAKLRQAFECPDRLGPVKGRTPDAGASDAHCSVGLDALKFLHNERKILFHGHEPLDTDTTPDLEGEHWLMHHGYTQGEGVANLDKVPETGALIIIGYPKFGGGLGGYARYIAVCLPDWPYGEMIGPQDAPLPKSEKPLYYDAAAGMGIR